VGLIDSFSFMSWAENGASPRLDQSEEAQLDSSAASAPVRLRGMAQRSFRCLQVLIGLLALRRRRLVLFQLFDLSALPIDLPLLR